MWARVKIMGGGVVDFGGDSSAWPGLLQVMEGTARIQPGADLATLDILLGQSGLGVLLQKGGAISSTRDFLLGDAAGTEGRYEIDGGHATFKRTIIGGVGGSGTFIQRGGIVDFDAIGIGREAPGQLEISGGILRGSAIGLGSLLAQPPASRLVQTGGTIELTGDVSLLDGATVTMSAGSMDLDGLRLQSGSLVQQSGGMIVVD